MRCAWCSCVRVVRHRGAPSHYAASVPRRSPAPLTAETTLKFVLEKLLSHDTVLSNELYEALRTRIKERRTVVTGILIYLQNPKKYHENVNRSDDTFTVPKKKSYY